MTTLLQASRAAPLETLSLGGTDYRVGSLTVEQRRIAVGGRIYRQEFEGQALNYAIAETVLALLPEHQPDLTAADVVPYVTEDMLPAIGMEITRQLAEAARLKVH